MDNKMWFGTEFHSEWIDAPSSGADVSPQGASSSGTLLDGGGFVNQKFGNHKMYQFSWGEASAVSAAQKMRAYASGVYGKGLLHPVDPMTYHTNVLPLQWSAPFLSGAGDYPPLRKINPLPRHPLGAVVNHTSSGRHNLPLQSANYTVDETVTRGFPGIKDSLYLPIPPGMYMRIGAFFATFGTGVGVYYGPATPTGVSEVYRLTPLTQQDTEAIAEIMPDVIDTHNNGGEPGIRIWIGRAPVSAQYPAGDAQTTGTFVFRAMMARLFPADEWATIAPVDHEGPWVPGEGNSGCRPDGMPTITYTSGVNGGQAGYALTLRETGSWEL